MQTVTLAFYIGWGGSVVAHLGDFLIRVATRSRTSHVELIPEKAEIGGTYVAYSSSLRDGGVRAKEIGFKEGKWIMVHVSANVEQIKHKFDRIRGKKYDYLGALFSPLCLSENVFGEDKIFCSESAAYFLDLEKPWTYSPGHLKRKITKSRTAIQLLFDALLRRSAPTHRG